MHVLAHQPYEGRNDIFLSVYGELRDCNHCADVDHQIGYTSLNIFPNETDEKDAGSAAKDQGNSGKIQKRPGTSKQGNHGTVEREQSESCRWLPSIIVTVPFFHCVFQCDQQLCVCRQSILFMDSGYNFTR